MKQPTHNTTDAAYSQVAVTAVYNPPGTNDPDVVTSQTGRVFVAKSPEQFTYDDDGNLTQDGRFNYTWNGENRLIKAETRDDLPTEVPLVRVEYAYDHQGRRVSRTGYAWNTDHWTLTADHSFLYDGWNVIAETIQNPQSTITNQYVWGLDLSGTRQGAGGIGGLLTATFGGTTSVSSAFFTYDANGNVGQLVGPDGGILAHYEYSPFGETVVSTGPLAQTNPFRFSTKWFDNATGLGDWGYRWYRPSMGRWLSRDPLGEFPDSGLYAAMRNNAVILIDVLGGSSQKTDPMQGCYDAYRAFFEQNSEYAKKKKEFMAEGRRRNCYIDVRCYCCKDKGKDFFMNTGNLTAAFMPEERGVGASGAKWLRGVMHICYDKALTGEEFSRNLGHEFQHFVDACEERKHSNNECLNALCAELRAFQVETGCTSPSACWKYLEPYWKKETSSGGKCAKYANHSPGDIQAGLRTCLLDGLMPPPEPVYGYEPFVSDAR